MHRLILSIFVITAAVIAPAAWLGSSGSSGWNEAVAASHLATQTSGDRGVTVKVTPRNLAGDAITWDFAVVFDTHSGELNDDLLTSAVLQDDAGRQTVPVAWDGPAPGGHHREGVLRFKPLSPQPQSIELRINRPGEAAPRSFRWQIR